MVNLDNRGQDRGAKLAPKAGSVSATVSAARGVALQPRAAGGSMGGRASGSIVELLHGRLIYGIYKAIAYKQLVQIVYIVNSEPQSADTIRVQ
jgi:hypothetical protein